MDNLVELVMTVPKPHDAHFFYQMRCRTTLGALVQLIARAERRIIISAPFIQTGQEKAGGIIVNALRAALLRGVSVDFLSTKSSLQNIRRSHLIPETYNNLQFFQTSTNISNKQMLGSHAKFCVTDSKSAYVGSANLTGPGLAGQLELGLLVHGEIAHQIEQFWDYSIELGSFVRVL